MDSSGAGTRALAEFLRVPYTYRVIQKPNDKK